MAVTEVAAKYTLTGPDGTVATFNDINDPNYVGMLTDVTGLDSPEIRESADDLVQQDGGIHGQFFYGRRPIVMTGIMMNPNSAQQRNDWQDQLSLASSALRADAMLSWAPSGRPQMQIAVRRNQPLRITGAWQKQFQLALVAADPRIYSVVTNTTTVTTSPATTTIGRGFAKKFNISYIATAPLGQLFVANGGNTPTYPVLRVYGPGDNPIITNFTTGEQIKLNYTLADTEWLTIDTLAHTVLLNDSANRYGAVDFINTSWFGLAPGVNDLRIAFDAYIAGAALRVDWSDAWL